MNSSNIKVGDEVRLLGPKVGEPKYGFVLPMKQYIGSNGKVTDISLHEVAGNIYCIEGWWWNESHIQAIQKYEYVDKYII